MSYRNVGEPNREKKVSNYVGPPGWNRDASKIPNTSVRFMIDVFDIQLTFIGFRQWACNQRCNHSEEGFRERSQLETPRRSSVDAGEHAQISAGFPGPQSDCKVNFSFPNLSAGWYCSGWWSSKEPTQEESQSIHKETAQPRQAKPGCTRCKQCFAREPTEQSSSESIQRPGSVQKPHQH